LKTEEQMLLKSAKSTSKNQKTEQEETR